MDQNKFAHKHVRQIFPWIKPRTLISWSERGIVKPAFEDAFGRGSRRLYSYGNLLEIAFADELLRYGIHFGMIQMAMAEFRIVANKDNHKYLFVFCRYKDGMLSTQGLPEWGEWYSMPKDKFNYGYIFLLGKSESRLTTSALVLDLETIKEYIDGRLKKITG